MRNSVSQADAPPPPVDKLEEVDQVPVQVPSLSSAEATSANTSAAHREVRRQTRAFQKELFEKDTELRNQSFEKEELEDQLQETKNELSQLKQSDAELQQAYDKLQQD
jgi:septal ring factor EnvC (AmiA/AmiB activator)